MRRGLRTHSTRWGTASTLVVLALLLLPAAARAQLLDGGRIVADGSHEALLRDVPGYAEILMRGEAESREPDLEAAGGGA